MFKLVKYRFSDFIVSPIIAGGEYVWLLNILQLLPVGIRMKSLAYFHETKK